MQASIVELPLGVLVFEVHGRTLDGLGRETDVGEGCFAPFRHVIQIHHHRADALATDAGEHGRARILRLEEILVGLVLAPRAVVQDLQRLAPVDGQIDQRRQAGLNAPHQFILAPLEMAALASADAALVAAAAFAVHDL